MMNRTTVLAAAASFAAAATSLAAAAETLKAQRILARDAAFAAGGTHVQVNGVENIIGSDRLETELVRALIGAGVGDLFDVAARLSAGPPTQHLGSPTADLETIWTDRLDGPLAPYVE